MAEKIYISGRITGCDLREAAEKFEFWEKELTLLGYNVVNPMKIPHEHGKTWEEYMRNDLIELLQCDRIFMLSDWSRSEGAKIEIKVAAACGINITFQHEFDYLCVYNFF